MSDFAKDNNTFSAAWQLYDVERMANESLREQLASAKAEIERLKSSTPDKREYLRCVISDLCEQVRERDNIIAAHQLRQQLADLKELNDNHAFNAKYFKAEYEKATKQLADSQLREQQLREALGFAEDCWFCEQMLTKSALTKMKHALVLSTDTSALEALIAKAGVKYFIAGAEYAYSSTSGGDGLTITEKEAAEAIHALPPIKLEDLK